MSESPTVPDDHDCDDSLAAARGRGEADLIRLSQPELRELEFVPSNVNAPVYALEYTCTEPGCQKRLLTVLEKRGTWDAEANTKLYGA